MKFQYYWDHGSNYIEEADMGSPADIQKLIARAQRAQKLTDRAATEGDGADVIMNNFEQTMDRFQAHFDGIKEYDKQIQAMLGATNGGPPLTETFQPSGTTVEQQPEVAHPADVKPEIDHATGDPIKT